VPRCAVTEQALVSCGGACDGDWARCLLLALSCDSDNLTSEALSSRPEPVLLSATLAPDTRDLTFFAPPLTSRDPPGGRTGQ
jgi:hypothetical protein